jgi:uncharacterized protein YjiS (DUF1127 family)
MSGKTFLAVHLGAGAGFRLAALALLAQVQGFARAVRHRRDVMRLAELDDRSLKDIGLVRSDIAGALDQPLGTDPSKILSVRRLEHRRRPRLVLASAPAVTPRIRAR